MTIIPDPDKHNKKLQEYYAKKVALSLLRLFFSNSKVRLIKKTNQIMIK